MSNAQGTSALAAGKVFYSFPLLKRVEIIQCMAELRIPVTDEDLREPQPQQARFILESFLDIIMSFRKEEVMQPHFSSVDFLHTPELHEESIPELIFSAALTNLLAACGIKDFSMGDVLKPESARFRTILSALINFTKFRQEHLSIYQNLITETEKLIEKKASLEESNQTLSSQLRMIAAQKEQQQPLVDSLTSEVGALEVEVNTLNKMQAALQCDTKKIKDETHEKAEQIASLKSKAQSAKQDISRIKSQIIPAPEKLKQELADMTTALQNEKECRAAADKRSRDLDAKLKAFDKIDHDLRRCMKILEDVQADSGKLRNISKNIENLQESISSQQTVVRELVQKEMHLKRQLHTVQEKLSRLQKQQDLKNEAADEAWEMARKEEQAIQQERSAAQAKIEENNQLIHEMNEKKSQMLKQHGNEMKLAQEAYDELQNRVAEYHQSLLQSLTDADSENQAPTQQYQITERA